MEPSRGLIRSMICKPVEARTPLSILPACHQPVAGPVWDPGTPQGTLWKSLAYRLKALELKAQTVEVQSALNRSPPPPPPHGPDISEDDALLLLLLSLLQSCFLPRSFLGDFLVLLRASDVAAVTLWLEVTSPENRNCALFFAVFNWCLENTWVLHSGIEFKLLKLTPWRRGDEKARSGERCGL